MADATKVQLQEICLAGQLGNRNIDQLFLLPFVDTFSNVLSTVLFWSLFITITKYNFADRQNEHTVNCC